MKLTTGIIIYLIIGSFQSLYSDDLPEKQETRADVKSINYSSADRNAREADNKPYAGWEDQQFKKSKKIPVRYRSVSPYRGFALVNLASTPSINESSNLESESNADNESEGAADEGIIEVAYARELLNQNIKPMAPTLIDYERW